MKILIATFTYLPNVDGVAESARLMVENFRSAGHEVRIATGKGTTPEANTPGTEAGVWRFGITGSRALWDGFHGEVEDYRDFLRTYSPDVIVFHCWEKWSLEVAIPVLPTLPSKSILFSHGYTAHLLKFKILPHGLRRWLRWLPYFVCLPWHLRRFDKVVFLSSKIGWGRFFDAWVAQKTRCRNTTVIPNGINTAGWQAIPANFRESEKLGAGVFFLCVANYQPRKNQEMALNAYLLAKIPNSVLVFIGSSLGDYGEALRARFNRVKENHPELDVRFLEHLNRERVISAFRSCDIAVLASESETQPLTLLEAMACAKPFISTDVGCVLELAGGIVVRDVATMAAQMCFLAANPTEQAKLGEKGKRCFDSHYSTEVTNPAWLDLIEEVVSPVSHSGFSS